MRKPVGARPIRATSVLFFVIAVLLAACGGNGDGAPQTTTPETATEATDPEAGGTGTAGDGEASTVRIAYVPTTTFFAAFVADAEGFFEEHGIDAELTAHLAIFTLPPVMGRQFDLGSATPPDLIRARAGGLDVVAVAGSTLEVGDAPTVAVYAGKDSGISELNDLEGKTMASGALASIIHVATLKWLTDSGVSTDEIDFVELRFPDMLDQLNAGQIDAAELVTPFDGQWDTEGHVRLGSPIIEVEDPARLTFWIADRQWAEQNQDAIRRVVLALEDAKSFIANNEERARELLVDMTGMPPAVANSIPFPHYDTDLSPNGEEFETWVTVLAEVTEFTQPDDMDSFLDELVLDLE